MEGRGERGAVCSISKLQGRERSKVGPESAFFRFVHVTATTPQA